MKDVRFLQLQSVAPHAMLLLQVVQFSTAVRMRKSRSRPHASRRHLGWRRRVDPHNASPRKTSQEDSIVTQI